MTDVKSFITLGLGHKPADNIFITMTQIGHPNPGNVTTSTEWLRDGYGTGTGVSDIKHHRLVMYGFCCKLVFFSEREKTLAYYVIYTLSVICESVMISAFLKNIRQGL